jgi:hypothetical protein
MSAVRSLPLRMQPISGEALDSWLEALAHRNETRYSDLLSAVGIQQDFRLPHYTIWMVMLTESELDALTAATGLHRDGLRAMTLSRFANVLDVSSTSRRVLRSSPATGWRAATQSRFCPRCVEATEGRWQSVWRLGWFFACLEHRCLLAATCPRCGRPQRRLVHPGGLVPQPGKCANTTATTAKGGRCGGDLSSTTTLSFPRHHVVLRAQERINLLLAGLQADFGVYADHPRSASAVFADITALGGLALRYPDEGELQKHLPADLLTAYIEHGQIPAVRTRPNSRRWQRFPTSGLTAAIAAVIALQILERENVTAGGEAMRWLTRRPGSPRPTVTLRRLGVNGRTTDVFEAVQIKASTPTLGACDRLRYKCSSAFPSRPAHALEACRRLARTVPCELWPDWSLRVLPPAPKCGAGPIALTCAVLMIGTVMSEDEVVSLLGSPINPQSLAHILNRLSRHRQWQSVSTALARLRAYLERHPSPIDYDRRRTMDYSALMSPEEWRQICRDTRTPEGAVRKAHAARRYLFKMVSGLPAHFLVVDKTLSRYVTGGRQGEFVLALTPPLAARLQAAGQRFLSCHGIDEPLTWSPPLSLLDDLDLPGCDLASVDVGALHLLANRPRIRIDHIARELDLPRDVVSHLLYQYPAPLLRSVGQNPRVSKISAALCAALSAQTLIELYHEQGLTISAVAERFGTAPSTVADIAAQHQITLQRFDIRESPDVLRPVLNRQQGWQRLERFASALGYPSMRAAAKALGIRDLSSQIRCLETELGASLINRTTGGRPMTPTQFGVQIAHAVAACRAARTGWIPARDTLAHAAIARNGEGSLTSDAAGELVRTETRTSSGRRRMERFALVVAYPTLQAAANGLRVNRQALTAQVRTLERHMGVSLFCRVASGLQMCPTPDAHAIADAIRSVNLE